ncbi:bifunctional diguanylate cyclase/phosphodiesterase [Pseudokineococcus basanitobsidens]|uniref:Bifunctional diguanylate cyclase/phosphodiesterase n=1 Tax=Pseudokineococcus basanitobsidens TaxID=1926649 RepID=A0ABU8RLR4_9ACTN
MAGAPTRPRTPLGVLTGGRPPAAALVVLVVVAGAHPVLGAGFDAGLDAGRGSALAAVSAAARTLLPVVAALVVLRRARRGPDEGPVWRWAAAACGVVAAAGLADDLVGAGRALPVVDGGGLVASLLLYQGLLHWNRFRGPTSGPGDWFNGVSAVLCAAALTTLGLRWAGVDPPGALLDEQLWLLSLAAAGTVLGTLPTVAGLAGMARDLRVWALGGAAALVVVVLVARLALPADEDATRLAWVVLAAVVALVALAPPGDHVPRPATAGASTAGALFVLVLAVVLLVVSRGPVTVTSLVPTAYGVLAVVGVAARAVHLVRDLSQLAVRREEALTDDLTGAGNRRGLTRHLEQQVRRAGETSLLLVDLDRFKEVNDRHGHATGDALLQAVVERLRRTLPRSVYLARPGGDEFAVVLGPRPAADAAALAEVVARAASAPVDVGGLRLQVGASVGVASADGGEGLAGEELLRRADVAMYTAKSNGGGTGRYDPVLDAAAAEASLLLAELRRVLATAGGEPRDAAPGAAGHLVVHHQIQVDGTGRPVGTEALVRWAHPRHGLVAPDRFLPLAERHGLMEGVTETVLRRSLADGARWRAQGQRLRTSVNLSTGCLSHPRLVPLVDEVLAATGTPPEDLVLEITETSVMADPETAVATTGLLRERGVGVSIDDYGTGHASLAYLTDLPATELKLDRAFAARLVADERTAAVVAGTVGLAHRLGLRVVAEGVEDAPTWEKVRALGCDESQGWFHGRPVPADEVLALLVAGGPGRVLDGSAAPLPQQRQAAGVPPVSSSC